MRGSIFKAEARSIGFSVRLPVILRGSEHGIAYAMNVSVAFAVKNTMTSHTLPVSTIVDRETDLLFRTFVELAPGLSQYWCENGGSRGVKVSLSWSWKLVSGG